jgi:hypothetical protein
MIFDSEELTPGVIKVTPRVCHGGELLAMWIVAYGKTAATHLWDIAVSRAFGNTEEIEKEVRSEMERKGCNRVHAQRNIILKSGLYKLKEPLSDAEVTISLPKDLAFRIKESADREGVTVDEYLKRCLGEGQ